MIQFSNPDSPSAVELIRRLVTERPVPLLCLVVKVNDRDEVVNVEFTDENTVKSAALAKALSADKEKNKARRIRSNHEKNISRPDGGAAVCSRLYYPAA